MSVDVAGWLRGVSLVACVGSGGVGKTTTAAALGLAAAVRGRKVIVLTIDPAKRLANSLGLEKMGGEPTPIDLSQLPEGTVAPGGELWAMMLDSRRTFDALIAAVAPSPESRDRILGNHVYRAMADALSGSQDYMATEKLHDLVRDGRWDLVVLDTPPVKNALDFLESPGRVVRFLDERVLSWFLQPVERKSMWGGRLLAGTSAFLYRLLGFVFGSEFLDDFAGFLADFNGLYDGFRKRHQAVVELLRAPGTAFVTVCAPTESSVDIALFFEEELRRRDLPRAGVVVNQVHRCAHPGDAGDLAAQATAEADGLPAGTAERLLARLSLAHDRVADLVGLERGLIATVRARVRGGFLQQVPRFERDVYDLPALRAVGEALVAAPAEPLASP